MGLGYVTGIPVVGRTSARANERRRSLRYRCAGLAEVLRIPRIGRSVRAVLSDLSLHGCLILTDFSFESGVPLEVLLQVKAISFRASGTVKVVRGPAAIGVEFTRISEGAQRRLAELLADLDRFVSLPARPPRSAATIECRPQSARNLHEPSNSIRSAEQAEFNRSLQSADLHPQRPAPDLQPPRLLFARPAEVDVFG